MPDLDALAWFREPESVNSIALGYTPKYCTDCGSELKLSSTAIRKSFWRFDPRTGEEITDTFTRYLLKCPRRNCYGMEYSAHA